MKKVALVGCGGINSWTIKNIKEMYNDMGFEDLYTTLIDDDVVEEKNLVSQNQNFQIDDIFSKKAEVLGKRYGVSYVLSFITEQNIQKELQFFDIIILGVDNHKTRKLVYEFCLKNNKQMIDLKAQGTQIGYVILEQSKGLAYYNNKYFSNAEIMEYKGSCQMKSDITNNHIENGNKIISFLGVYALLLKILRNENIDMKEYKMVY
jgi:molybdopterin/thiamine biosynthesis adenylyltransferase